MFCHAHRTCDATDPSRAPAQSTPAAVSTGYDVANTTNPSLTDIAERRLLAAMSTGSRSALRRLHFLYFPRLAKFFVHLTATSAPEVVEDLIRDTMFDVWRESATFDSESSIHVAIMRLAWARGRQRICNIEELRSSSEQPLSHGRDPQSSLSRRPEAPHPLSEALGTLPLTERAIVHLVHSSHSRQEVADILRMSCESVDAYLANAMNALRPRLVPRISSIAADNWGSSIEVP